MRYSKTKADKFSLQCRQLLYALVLTLVFEGIIRKLIPSALGIGLFFLKDILCFAALFILFNKKFRSFERRMYNMSQMLFLAFIPLIIYTGNFDVRLSAFGPKQYMLFIVIALLVPSAFPVDKEEEFKKFCAFLALLLLPTTLVAMLQNALPPTHWLNLGVGGDSLKAFSAAGYLRVSSTFSFTAQFSWFLNFVCVFFMIRFFLLPVYANKFLKMVERLMPIILGSMLIVGAFITGGRTAVLGCGSCLALGFLISGLRSPQWLFSKGILVGAIAALGLVVLSAAKPEFFAAYTARSQGTETMSHADEVESRVLGGFVDWVGWFENQKLSSFLLGNGLGVMSNGSDQISPYAKEIRSSGFWTESDIASTFWEGGLYLAVIWYGFRLAVILFSIEIWRTLKKTSYALASSFLLSYIIITGIIGTLGIQPPVAIWWFLCIGALITIKNFDSAQQPPLSRPSPFPQQLPSLQQMPV